MKKILSLVLIVLLSITLVGCGNNSDDVDSSETNKYKMLTCEESDDIGSLLLTFSFDSHGEKLLKIEIVNSEISFTDDDNCSEISGVPGIECNSVKNDDFKTTNFLISISKLDKAGRLLVENFIETSIENNLVQVREYWTGEGLTCEPAEEETINNATRIKTTGYYVVHGPTDSFEFKANGEAILRGQGCETYGTYKINGNTINIILTHMSYLIDESSRSPKEKMSNIVNYKFTIIDENQLKYSVNGEIWNHSKNPY